MRNGIDIFGSITYFISGEGYRTNRFNYLNMSIYIHPRTGISLFSVDFVKPGWGFTVYLDPGNSMNGIIYNGKRYFGNALKKFYIEFNNLVNEQAINELE